MLVDCCLVMLQYYIYISYVCTAIAYAGSLCVCVLMLHFLDLVILDIAICVVVTWAC